MRLRTALAAATIGALTFGAAGVPAHADTAPPEAGAGTLVTWGDGDDPNGGEAIPVPADLTEPVTSVAASNFATGVVTLDGAVRVWGNPVRGELAGVPTDATDAAAVALTAQHGAVLHKDGRITAWGNFPELSEVPSGLRAKAIALQVGTGYAVRPDGTLATWGVDPDYPPAGELTDLVDVSAVTTHALALQTDGTVISWGAPVPGLNDVPDFGDKEVTQIATGQLYSGAVFEDGTIDLWGFQVPAGAPAFDGQTPATKVVSLSLGAGSAAAVTADGAVHAWGASSAVTDVPESLTGEPVSAVAVGKVHAAAVVTTFRELTEPTIAGKAHVGSTLTATPATFSVDPDSVNGQWLADGDPIDGETGTTLVLDEALLDKTISYRTTATRGDDTVETTSAEVGPVSPLSVPSTTEVDVTRAVSAYGKVRKATATVTADDGPATGKVTFALGRREVTRSLTAGKATWRLPRYLPAGRHRVIASYDGNDATDPSTSAPATVKVRKAATKINSKAKYKKRKRKVVAKARVRAANGANPRGKVKFVIKRGKKTVAKKKDKLNRRDIAKVVLEKRKIRRPGKYRVIVKYLGSNNLKRSKDRAKYRVRR